MHAIEPGTPYCTLSPYVPVQGPHFEGVPLSFVMHTWPSLQSALVLQPALPLLAALLHEASALEIASQKNSDGASIARVRVSALRSMAAAYDVAVARCTSRRCRGSVAQRELDLRDPT